MGKQDPYICINMGHFNESTATIQNGGSDVTFPMDMNINIDKDILLNEKMKFRVMDENSGRKDVLIGFGDVSLSGLLSSLGKEKKIKIDLGNDVGSVCGLLFVSVLLSMGVKKVRRNMYMHIEVCFRSVF